MAVHVPARPVRATGWETFSPLPRCYLIVSAPCCYSRRPPACMGIARPAPHYRGRGSCPPLGLATAMPGGAELSPCHNSIASPFDMGDTPLAKPIVMGGAFLLTDRKRHRCYS